MQDVMELIRMMSDDESNSIYLREIALLMEENDKLRVEIDKIEKRLKNNDKYISDFMSKQKKANN
jgi:regulator of replication initiation timing